MATVTAGVPIATKPTRSATSSSWTALGALIVRDLVVSQLEGTISMEPVPPADGGGTRVAIAVPVRAPR